MSKVISFYKREMTNACLFGLVMLVTACTSVPQTIVKAPLTAKPLPTNQKLTNNGSIYQLQSARGLFEDRHALGVGDILTVNILESTTAGKSVAGSSSKSGNFSTAFAVPAGASFKSTSAVGNSDKSDATASNNFTGSIGVTVIEVLDNGNLLVSGEKQVALDRGAEYVRFSGVINPDYIKQGNTIASTQVSDVKVEYRTGTNLDSAQIMTFFQRAFMSIIPF